MATAETEGDRDTERKGDSMLPQAGGSSLSEDCDGITSPHDSHRALHHTPPMYTHYAHMYTHYAHMYTHYAHMYTH
jgi:hypothetical protein